MKNEVKYTLTIVITILVTAFIIYSVCNKKFEKQIKVNTNSSTQYSEEECINFLEVGTQNALNYVATYKRHKMDYSIETYIKTIETAFKDDVDFIKLFKSDEEKISKLNEHNLKELYPKSRTDGSIAPMLYNSSAEGFEQAKLILLEQVVIAYCSNRQDYQPCIDVVFNKKYNH